MRNVKRKNFEFSKFVKYGQRYFDSERLWYSKLSFLKLRTVELTISFQQFLQSSRSQIFVKKDEVMRTFDICYENRWFFHRSLLKAVRNCRIKRMKNWKLAFWTVYQIKFKSFLNFIFAKAAKTWPKLLISI